MGKVPWFLDALWRRSWSERFRRALSFVSFAPQCGGRTRDRCGARPEIDLLPGEIEHTHIPFDGIGQAVILGHDTALGGATAFFPHVDRLTVDDNSTVANEFDTAMTVAGEFGSASTVFVEFDAGDVHRTSPISPRAKRQGHRCPNLGVL